MTKEKQIIVLNAAREVSSAMSAALEAVRTMQPVKETWEEREQRLAEGRSSPTGWPIKRLPRIDDGLTIPKRRALIVQPAPVVRRRIAIWLEAMDQRVPLDAPSFFDGMPWWQQVVYGITPAAIIILALILA